MKFQGPIEEGVGGDAKGWYWFYIEDDGTRTGNGELKLRAMAQSELLEHKLKAQVARQKRDAAIKKLQDKAERLADKEVGSYLDWHTKHDAAVERHLKALKREAGLVEAE